MLYSLGCSWECSATQQNQMGKKEKRKLQHTGDLHLWGQQQLRSRKRSRRTALVPCSCLTNSSSEEPQACKKKRTRKRDRASTIRMINRVYSFSDKTTKQKRNPKKREGRKKCCSLNFFFSPETKQYKDVSSPNCPVLFNLRWNFFL